jgi:catechol 2,3-dioxygenase-like lactoylglutathione lyase family enzyme
MSDSPYFHIAILVHNLEEAIERYSSVLGIEFVDPTLSTARFWEKGREERMLEARLAYSKQPQGPYIELVEAQGDGLFSPSRGEGVHHVGIWESDCEARVEEMERNGVEMVAAQYTPEGKIIVAYFEPQDMKGVMLEIVDSGRKDMMERWFAGEPYVD